MRTCHTEPLMLSCQSAQHLCPLLNLKTMGTEILQFLMVGRDGRGVDDQT